MKKNLAFVLSVVLILSLALPCAAAEDGEFKYPCINVSTINPMEQPVPFGVNYPTSTYYPHSSGSLPFSGNAAYSSLWLNKMVLGCNQYVIYIYNVSDNKLKYDICRQYTGDIYNNTVSPHSSVSLRINADPNEIVCMRFYAPSNFNGRISCGCNS